MVSRTKKPSPKTARAKPAVSKKATPKPVKSTAKKSSSAKASTKKPVAQERDSLIKLRTHVNDIEKRLKRAGSLTRSSVRALQKSYESLSEGQGEDLTVPIAQLSARLTGLIEQTRADVAHDLRVVMEDPRLETVSAALTKANQRLTRAEQEQAHAIGTINTQIADLAIAVDNRMSRETRERERVQEVLSSRIDDVENISAEAMKGIGDKVSEVTDELTRRAGEQAETLIKTATDQAENQQRSLDEHRSEVDRRIEAIEDDQRNTIPSIERRLVTLSSRLEELERFDTAPAAAQLPPLPVYDAPPYMETASDEQPPQEQVDAFSPSMPEEFEAVTPPPNLNGAQGDQVPVPVAMPVVAASGLTEYVPEVYQPQDYQLQGHQAAAPQMEIQAGAPEAYTPPVAAQAYEPGQLTEYAPEAYAPPQEYAQQATPAPAPVMPPFAQDGPADAALPPMPQDASLGFEQGMDAQRPGAEPKKKKRRMKRKKSGGEGGSGSSGKGGSVRLLALMAGVAVIGLFAATKVMPGILGSGSEQTETATDAVPSKSFASVEGGEIASTQENFASIQAAVEMPTERPLVSEEPIGDYKQGMTAPDLGRSADGKPSAQKVTLEAAAADGNPVAQFQLGLSHLEAGRNAEAVRLIRLAANQGQPAAQYRLGKLYEAGIGVKANPDTAMELLARAAKNGNSVAMHDLGHYYAIGAPGREADITQAAIWFHKAADHGMLDSQYNLGVLYSEGSGVERDLVQSYVWFSLAAAQGDPYAMKEKERVSLDLSKQQQEQATARLKAFTPQRGNEAANGIFRNTPWTVERTARKAPAQTVKTAQQMLSRLGYDVGTPDGAMGPKTRNAVIRFERANGLPETGRIDAALIERLSLASGV